MNVRLPSMERGSILKVAALLFAVLFHFSSGRAQFAVKTNVLYDATTTPNVGAELGIGSRSTVSLVYGLNPWSFNSDKGKRKAMHWVVMPEYRWWLCSKFDGHFFGVHAMGGQYNAANINLPIPGAFFGGENLAKGVRDYRYQGWYAGGGITYGYQWILGKHWNFEAEVGAGYVYADYKKFNCADCGGKVGEGHTNYLGITKLGLSFIYLF
ncbi:MAG: DUF3575 domain-containing protein [Muribaculaceae bacterium]|nr:DUF3575 domain-containing protein [Muribaculaceae bacterium]MDE6027011.1 DUF3575 domain-containing protein [Muribaculaceae bacterium]